MDTSIVHGRPDQRWLEVSSDVKVHYRVIHPAGAILDPEEHALAKCVGERSALFVIDQTVHRIYGVEITKYISRHVAGARILLLPGGDKTKTFANVERILSVALESELPRNGIVVAIGGGAILDLAGLAAALFRRGVAYLKIPTTLVGIVDVGVGVKQGINFGGRKSLVGAYYASEGALIDRRFIRTLPHREISCGTAEIIKVALISSERLFALLSKHAGELADSKYQTPAGDEVIFEAQRLMIEELQPNLFEKEFARLVDFGHTLSPKLEERSKYLLPHGLAVAADMLLSLAIGAELGVCSVHLLDEVMDLCEEFGICVDPISLTVDEITEAFRQTRIHRAGNLNLVIPEKPGVGQFVQDVPRPCLVSAMERLSRKARVQYGTRHRI